MARPVAPSPSSVYSERQSEMSFGILDYYAREASPPPTPKLDLVPRIGTPVTDPGLGKFDFGLGLGLRGLVKEKPADKEASRDGLRAVENLVTDALAGAQKEGPLSPERSSPPGMPAKKTPNSEPPPAKKTYSLFPKDSTPPSRPSITLASERDSSPPHQRISMVPSHQQPDPSYRPRKESVTSSLRSRKDSFTSYRPPPQTQRIPLRILSAGSSTYSYATPRSSAATTNRPSISPPDSAASRWSEDTITSPTTAVAPGGGPRTSFGSLLGAVRSGEGRDSGQYPACFFEDDDDEVVPLRRKLNWGRSVSLQSQGQRKVLGEDMGRKRASSWKKVLLCGCAG